MGLGQVHEKIGEHLGLPAQPEEGGKSLAQADKPQNLPPALWQLPGPNAIRLHQEHDERRDLLHGGHRAAPHVDPKRKMGQEQLHEEIRMHPVLPA